MRLAAYIFFAYVVLGLQVGVSRYLAFHGAAPNLALLAVIFIALNAPKNAALLGCFCLGFLQDLLTTQPPGLYAFSYGFVAMLIVAMQQMINRAHPATHFILALVGGFITLVVLLLHSWIHPAGQAVISEGKVILGAMRIPAGVEFTRVIYTAALAVPALWAMGRIRGAFAFEQGKRKIRW